jgi:hypothetical protein
MFRLLANRFAGNRVAQTNALFRIEPDFLTQMLEWAWRTGGRAPFAFRGRRVTIWDHLIYAYMIENSRAYEIFQRVAWELVHGERLGMPLTLTTHQWLRTTEAILFSDWAPRPLDLVSRVRPDLAASRRNAYYRMFGMDLNHGADGNAAYPYTKPDVANRDFVVTFEEFLRLVWRAIENESNTSGPNETDEEAIGDLALRLQNMLNARRGGAANGLSLARDEFVHVTTMSWFHLTVESDNDVIRDLRAGGPSAEERLRLVGERVGVPAHGKSHSFFQIATAISVLLTQIELGQYSTGPLATTLFRPALGNPIRDNVLRVLNHWSMITGRDMKAGRVTVSPRRDAASRVGSSPLRAPMPAAPTPNTNGREPVGTASGT